jgi:Protein of unknown function (DUF2924)
MGELQEELAALSDMKLAELKIEWRRVYHSPPPVSYTSDLLMRGIAYRLQEKTIGKLPLQMRSHLEKFDHDCEAAAKPANGSKPGTCFVRSWKGRSWTVMATDRGYECEGQTYRSLSAIARMITGTRWNGPRFFGMRKQA